MSELISLSSKLRTANGSVFFRCPGCDSMHGVRVEAPATDLWGWNRDVDRPTFTPSLLVQCDMSEPPVTSENLEDWKRTPWVQTKVHKVCHSFITDGRIQFLSDCTHDLAGKTVDLPDWLEGA